MGHPAGCSMRLSTAPRLSANVKMRVREQSSTAALFPTVHGETDHAAEGPHLRLGDSVTWVVGKDGWCTCLTAAWPRSNSTMARALAQCRSIRMPKVLTPRCTRKQSKGPGTPPVAF